MSIQAPRQFAKKTVHFALRTMSPAKRMQAQKQLERAKFSTQAIRSVIIKAGK